MKKKNNSQTHRFYLDIKAMPCIEALIFRDHGITDGNAEKPI